MAEHYLMKNYRLFHTISCLVFLSLGFYFNNIYHPETANFFSTNGGNLFKVPLWVSAFYAIRDAYWFSDFGKDILCILGGSLLLYTPDFWLNPEIEFIVPNILAFSGGTVLSFLIITIYEKYFYQPTQQKV